MEGDVKVGVGAGQHSSKHKVPMTQNSISSRGNWGAFWVTYRAMCKDSQAHR